MAAFPSFKFPDEKRDCNYIGLMFQPLNDLYIQTRIRFCLLNSFSHPISGLVEFQSEVQLMEHLIESSIFFSYIGKLASFSACSLSHWFTSTFFGFRLWLFFFRWCLITGFKMSCINSDCVIYDKAS